MAKRSLTTATHAPGRQFMKRVWMRIGRQWHAIVIVCFLSDREKNTYYIGLLAEAWATLEALLDGLSYMCFKEFGGSETNDQIPRSLSRKTEFIARTFKGNIRLAELKSANSYLMKEIEKASQIRNTCIHGAAVHDAVINPKFPIISLVKYYPLKIEPQYFIISLDNILNHVSIT